MKYIILATDTTLPIDRSTLYWHGKAGCWQHSRQWAKRYSASDAAMMKIAMHDNPKAFDAERMRDIETVPA